MTTILNLADDDLITNDEIEESKNGSTPIPAGRYTATIFEITSSTIQAGKNQGKPRLSFQFRIADGEKSADGHNQGNRRVFLNVDFFKKLNSKTNKKFMDYKLVNLAGAIGLDADALNRFNSDDWEGREVSIDIIVRNKRVLVDGEWVDSDELPENHTDYGALLNEVTGKFKSTSAPALAGASAGASKAASGGFDL